MTSCRTISRNKNWKESENPRFYGQTNFFFWHHALQPFGGFSHMAVYRSSPKNRRKTNLQPISNKNSPRAYMESKFDVLGIAGNLVEYVVHLPKRTKKKIKHISLLIGCLNGKWSVFGLKELLGLMIANKEISLQSDTVPYKWIEWQRNT
jgi:hypothetical protein